jgi:hypothetical protein
MAFAIGLYVLQRIKDIKKTALHIATLTVVCIGLMCINFIGVYSSARLEVAWSRTQAFSVIVIVALIMLYGVVAGALIRQHVAKSRVATNWLGGTIIILGLAIGTVNGGYIADILQFSSAIQNRAAIYDQRDREIKGIKSTENTDCPITLPITYLVGTQESLDLIPDADHALNIGMERYYDLPCHVLGR